MSELPSRDEIVELLNSDSPQSLVEYFAAFPHLINHAFEGDTPLQMAVILDSVKMVTQLLQLGALPDLADMRSERPLVLAVKDGLSTMVEVLLAFGADINQTDQNGFTPLMLASRARGPSAWPMAELLLKHGAKPDLNSWVYMHRLDLVEEWLRRNPDAVKNAPFPQDLIYSAILQQSRPLLELLLNFGAEINCQAIDGLSPLFRAMQPGKNSDLLKVLIEHGANSNLPDYSGATVFDYAKQYGDLYISPQALELLSASTTK
jgi:uncharacterized protein